MCKRCSVIAIFCGRLISFGSVRKRKEPTSPWRTWSSYDTGSDFMPGIGSLCRRAGSVVQSSPRLSSASEVHRRDPYRSAKWELGLCRSREKQADDAKAETDSQLSHGNLVTRLSSIRNTMVSNLLIFSFGSCKRATSQGSNHSCSRLRRPHSSHFPYLRRRTRLILTHFSEASISTRSRHIVTYQCSMMSALAI
jgi:hypothetical protein